ncbi:MAG TPA: aminotransferase class V-fold PLP-dependent enzyme [Candidatus Thermoplasmatota archaeon]|jgi:selenocysteine lyase/cysteine desulfurase|nr:aminotransferase class V-fold PLP-dependent enzyme [Candidatus Thermoplasmatota archaeon]
MDWSAWRDEFPILGRKTYLNTCSLTPLGKAHRAATERFFAQWDELGASAWYGPWTDAIDELRGKVAKLLHAPKEEIALAPNVSSALGTLMSCLPLQQQSVVASDMDFPTLTYHFMAKPHLDVRFVKGDGVEVPLQAYVRAMDPSVAVLAFSQVWYQSGGIAPAQELTKLARQQGALALCDGYQGAGHLPTDPRAMGCDVYITGGLKWLLGGTGIAFAWVRRELHEQMKPRVTGWFANARQFDFDSTRFSFHTDARRFEAGTPSLHAVHMASAGLDIVLRIGESALRDRTRALDTDLVDRLQDHSFQLKTPEAPDRRGGIVAVAWDREDPSKAVQRLAQENIIVDARPGRVRLSPYFYNTEEDNERAVQALVKARG